MRHPVFLLVAAVLVMVAAGSSSRPSGTAPVPLARDRSVSGPSPHPHQVAKSRQVRVTVSGPYDTVMRVARGTLYARVNLRGIPFDHTFVEPQGRPGFSVWAGSAHARGHPVRCEIWVNGVSVARKSATQRNAHGLATVSCRIPDPI